MGERRDVDDGVARDDGAVVLAVRSVAARPERGFAKPAVDALTLRASHGAVGDLHAGTRRSREVHLVGVERYDLLRAAGADVADGYLGENVTTRGVDLLSLPLRTRLRLGPVAVLVVTGLRFPRHEDPSTDRVGLSLDADGVPVGRVGVFAVVEVGGTVRAGDEVVVLEQGSGSPPVL
ncbi:MOSC domain-containing protein [Aquipuribacter sp. MA13-6]|uniref:MOSC domain-containing protein n=1 Tax=unclassified Aquipuribacter TaxID=2635084 RepID=UPI003EED3E9D